MIQNCLLKNTKTTIFLLDALVSVIGSLNSGVLTSLFVKRDWTMEKTKELGPDLK